MKFFELKCLQYRHLMLIMSVALIVCGCAISRFNDQGELVTQGEDLIPGVLPDGSADVIGSVVDAAQKQGGQIVNKALSHDWLGVIVSVLGFGAAVVGGITARRAWRRRQAAKALGAPPKESDESTQS